MRSRFRNRNRKGVIVKVPSQWAIAMAVFAATRKIASTVALAWCSWTITHKFYVLTRSLEANEEMAHTQKSVEAIQRTLRDRRSRNSDSEFSTPRKYSWDYGADLAADENQGQLELKLNITLM